VRDVFSAIARARSLTRQGGQAVFEFALVFPIFIGLLLLMFDFGLLMYSWVSVSNAAREGARYAAVNCNDGSCTAAEIRTWVVARGGGVLKSSPAPVCTSVAPYGAPATAEAADMICVNWLRWDNGAARGAVPAERKDSVVVKVVHRYGFLFLPVDYPVISCAVMRLEANEAAGTVNGGGGPTAC
jgi:TadE-like protein